MSPLRGFGSRFRCFSTIMSPLWGFGSRFRCFSTIISPLWGSCKMRILITSLLPADSVARIFLEPHRGGITVEINNRASHEPHGGDIMVAHVWAALFFDFFQRK